MNQRSNQVTQQLHSEQETNFNSTSNDRSDLLISLFESTFEQFTLGKALIDVGGNLIRTNSKMTELTGYSADQLHTEYFENLTCTNQDSHRNQVFEILQVDQAGLNEEGVFVFKRPDGKVIHLLTSLTRVLDPKGELNFYVKSFEDVTALRNSELQIRRLAQEFDNFVYRAFHDLQGPLSSIEGVCNIMKLSQDNDEIGKYADMIGVVAVKMKKALMGMLEAAKINDLEMKKVVINFEYFISNLITDLGKIPESKYVNLQYRVQPGIFFSADPAYVNIIIKHLLENAIFFQDSQKNEALIELEVKQENESQVCIRVSDNGIGISEEDQQDVFGMFCRKSNLSQGSGIGLYLVKQSVERLGGEVFLRSQLGEGTVVEVYL